MIPEKLKKSEQSFELLQARLSLLAESEVSYIAPILAKFGISESVWEDAIASYFAALSAESSVSNIPHRQITIIGGSGRMGRFFTQQLSAAGHNVRILESEDWERADQLLYQADLVLISVPIEQTVNVIKRAAKYLQPTTALADITSLKTQPVQTMLESHCGPVMGLHPMFGPNVKSFLAQKVVVTPGREDDSFQWFLDWIKSQGGELILSTPEEHDRLMVMIQATRHFSRLSLGVFLAQENIDIDRTLSMSSPSYRLEIDLIERLFAQRPHLCADIMLATEERCQAIERLANTYSRLAQLVARKDRDALIQEFAATQKFLEERTLSDSLVSPSFATLRS